MHLWLLCAFSFGSEYKASIRRQNLQQHLQLARVI